MIRNEHGSSRMDTVLKMLLIAFVSLLAFSSGVYFGKQMSDSDHQMKALESDFSSQKYAAGEEEGSDDEIAEEEVAALSDKYVNEEKGDRGVASEGHGDEHGAAAAHGDDHAAPAAAGHGDAHAAPAKADAHGAKADAHGSKAEAHGEDAHAAPAAKADAHAAPAKAAAHGDEHAAPAAATTAAKQATGKVDLSAAHRAAQRVANNAAPTKEAVAPIKAENRNPTSLPKTVGSSAVVEYTVQVASYPTNEAAKEHAGELVRKGFPAFPVEATVNGKVWYRVSVGSFKTMKDATTYRAQLLKQADLQSAIVQRITR